MQFDTFTQHLLISILNEDDSYSLEADSAGEPDQEEYVKFGKKKKKEEPPVQPFHGMSLTPELEAGVKTVLKYGGDDPETPEKETSSDTSWQGVNQATFNEMKRKRMELERQQGMVK